MKLIHGLAVGAALALTVAAGGAAHANKLTPWGAEAGANKDGSIPAWVGEKGLGGKATVRGNKIVDPFPGDKPILTINRGNVGKYQANLSPGQIEMIKRNPGFVINVYKTRRIFDMPADEIANIKAEAGRVKLAGDTGLQGLDKTHVPFPQPKNGVEAIWNHITRFRAGKVVRNYWQVPVQQNGSFTPQGATDLIIFRKSLKRNAENDNMLIKFLQIFKSPAQLEGNVLLVHEFIDQVKQPRAAWLYNPGQRRVRRAPNVAYDGPANGADGLRTTDDFDMYNGSPNRYTWKYLGKREMFVPANGWRTASQPKDIRDLMGPKYQDPKYSRYEKRRVHVVEARLKGSERHIYSRRTFYLDEDGWAIKMKDQYDSRGNLWRYGELHTCYFTSVKSAFNCSEPIYDFQAGRYIMLSAPVGHPFHFKLGKDADITEKLFTTSSLRRLGR